MLKKMTMTDQSSTTSRKSSLSSVSQTVASIKTAVKKGAKVLAQPLQEGKNCHLDLHKVILEATHDHQYQ
jgi:hypothetical protein